MFTAEDHAVLAAASGSSADTLASMLMGDCVDARIMREREEDRYWAKLVQYELDYIA